jgi:hypothetical protein
MRFADVFMLLLDRLSKRSAGADALKSLIMLATHKWVDQITCEKTFVNGYHDGALAALLIETGHNSPTRSTGIEEKELEILVSVTRTVDETIKGDGRI